MRPMIRSFGFTVFAESVTLALVVVVELTAELSLSIVLLDGRPVETVKSVSQKAMKAELLAVFVTVTDVIPLGALGHTARIPTSLNPAESAKENGLPGDC
jgi:hypothetical protein